MKRIFWLTFLLPLLLAAGTIDVHLVFEPSDLAFDRVNGYDVVTIAGEYYTTEPGKPLLPVVSRSVLLPPDAEITGVKVIARSTTDLPGTFDIHPAQRPVILSAKTLPPFVAPDLETYASATPYPKEIAGFTRSGSLAGFRIAALSISPLQYVPAEQKLRLSTRIRLEVTYESNAHPPVTQTAGQRARVAGGVAGLVVNPDMLNAWAPPLAPARDGDEIDMIVVTSRTLAAAFQPFADWKTKKGYRTKVIGTDSIYVQYPGVDNAAKIRNCVIDYWQNHGLKYVVLGGDAQQVPTRLTRLTVEGMTEDVPADMYFADLQYSWNSDRNNYYGEMTDSVDLYHDVAVGRVPADNAVHVATFVRKDTMYEKHPDTLYLKSVLLPSEMLFEPFHGKVTNNLIAGLLPTGWKTARLEDPRTTATRDSLRNGYQFCHFCCHGSYDLFGSSLNISQVGGITAGNRLSIVHANSCNVGEFDDEDCISESLVNFAGGGSIAVLGNARYGWGYPPALGPSELIDIELYRQLLSRGRYEIGGMNAGSKDYYHGLSMNQEVWRWCIYELTLFGDPSLAVWSERPAVLNVSHPASIPAAPQTMRVSAAKSGAPLKDALVCLQQGSTTYAVGRTNSLGWVDLFINPLPGTLNVTVTARNCYPYESTCTVTSGSAQPAITLQSVRITDDGNHNGRLDPGENAALLVSLRNSGNAAATGLNGTLRTLSAGVNFTDSLDVYGSLNPGDTAPGTGYALSVAPDVTPGTEVEFLIRAVGNEGTWEPFFKTIVGERLERKIWADHDTGNCILTVSSLGSIGTLAPYNEGSGFKYPRDASYGSLYAASFAVGIDSTYIVDRFYGRPSTTINTDWRIIDTLHRAVPPEHDAQEYRAVYDDGNHPRPRGLTVEQWSASTKPAGYDDFVVLQFDLWNRGASPINGLYAGVLCDFDVYNVLSNAVKSDTVRRLTYSYDPAGSGTPYVGIRLLYPPVYASLSAIRNSVYVTPGSMMSEAVKDSFLRGSIRVRNSTANSNWSEVVSAGPFDIPVSWYQRVAFAFVGGMTENALKANSDSAQNWYQRNSVVEDGSSRAAPPHNLLSVEPSLTAGPARIRYHVAQAGPVTLAVYDVTGKRLATLAQGPHQPGDYVLTLSHSALVTGPERAARGLYLVKLRTPTNQASARLILNP